MQYNIIYYNNITQAPFQPTGTCEQRNDIRCCRGSKSSGPEYTSGEPQRGAERFPLTGDRSVLRIQLNME